MSLVIKNITSPSADVDLTDMGRRFLAGAGRTMEGDDFAAIARSADGGELETSINAGDLIVELDGTELTITGSLRVCRMLPQGHFRVTANDKQPGFLDEKIDAGEGVQTEVVGPGGAEQIRVKRDQGVFAGQLLPIIFHGDVDEWYSFGSSTKESNSVSYRFPFDVELVGVQFSNSSDGSKFILEFHKALSGAGSSNNLLASWTMDAPCRNLTQLTADGFNVANITDVAYAAGDKIGIYVEQNGGNQTRPIDAEFMLIFKILDHSTGFTGEDYSGDFTR